MARDKKNEETRKTDLYGLLQVRPSAPKEVIEGAYDALSKLGEAGKGERSKLNYKIKLDLAKDILCDTKKRAKYDAEYTGKAPDMIGDYRILEPIGEGGFAKTYKAEHSITGGLACIKHCPNLTPAKEEVLMKEINTLWDLRHHALPAVRSVERQEDGSLGMVMSYIDGPTLEEVVEKHDGLDAENVCWIAQRLLDALRYMHYNGVVHGDLNPKNVIIWEDHHIASIVDYGLASVKPTQDSKSAGYTPHFSPPEQVSGGPLLPEADFYSLGVTMIYALGGDIVDKQVPASTPDAMCDFIGKLINKDVLSRPNWQDEDLIQTMLRVRRESFGRAQSGMKKLSNV